jgi:hypothetical protein
MKPPPRLRCNQYFVLHRPAVSGVQPISVQNLIGHSFRHWAERLGMQIERGVEGAPGSQTTKIVITRRPETGVPTQRRFCAGWGGSGRRGICFLSQAFDRLSPLPRQVIPRRVRALDERNAFCSIQPLDLFFSINCISDIMKSLEVHKAIDFVALRKAFDLARLMLGDSPANVVCHARIDPPRFARHDIDPEVPFTAHKQSFPIDGCSQKQIPRRPEGLLVMTIPRICSHPFAKAPKGWGTRLSYFFCLESGEEAHALRSLTSQSAFSREQARCSS